MKKDLQKMVKEMRKETGFSVPKACQSKKMAENNEATIWCNFNNEIGSSEWIENQEAFKNLLSKYNATYIKEEDGRQIRIKA